MSNSYQSCPTCGNPRTSMSFDSWRTPDCFCAEQYKLATLYTQAEIPNTKPDEFWYQDLTSNWQRSKTCKEYKTVCKYIATLPDRIKTNTNLLFKGPMGQGTGKTFLAVSILKEALKLGLTGKWVDFVELQTKPTTLRSLDSFQVLVFDNIDPYSSAHDQSLLNAFNLFVRHRKQPMILVVDPLVVENKPLSFILNANRRKFVEISFETGDDEKLFAASNTIFPDFDDLFVEGSSSQAAFRNRAIK